jgi:hypothetical protein
MTIMMGTEFTPDNAFWRDMNGTARDILLLMKSWKTWTGRSFQTLLKRVLFSATPATLFGGTADVDHDV